jgi:predicted Ser/Thr protein kinase
MGEENGRRQGPGGLAAGTRVGRLRVVERVGRGVQGAVYRAEWEGPEGEGSVALKVALAENNPRFQREVELLRRVEHESVPRVYEAGEWEQGGGRRYPYVVMEWVEGEGLYAWAERKERTVEEVSRALGQVARALEAVREVGCVHRDVKGENVVVRRRDGRAVLVDAGLSTYAGAQALTPRGLVAGTPAYRSPEAALFEVSQALERAERYEAGPEDDVYALGVVGYRVLVGEYPPAPEPELEESGRWRVRSQGVELPGEVKRGEWGRLAEVVERMLEVRREERLTARRAAEALEELAAREEARRAAERGARARRRESARRWGMRAGVAVSVTLVLWWVGSERTWREEARGGSQQEGGATGLGEEVAAASRVRALEAQGEPVLGEEAQPEPRPGQARPDAKGRCPRKRQVALNGGCWRVLGLEREECEDLSGEVFQGTCYVPIVSPRRRSTSHPPAEP